VPDRGGALAVHTRLEGMPLQTVAAQEAHGSAAGPKGDAGPQGAPGAKGDTGQQGEQGLRGDPGTAQAYALVQANTPYAAPVPVFVGPHPGFTTVSRRL
jgi:hypothetical protein